MSLDKEEIIQVYTDGGCSGNPGPGGWGVVILADGQTRELSGGEAATTNNRMELTAVIKALEALHDNPESRARKIDLYTDSQYVKNGITSWIHAWQKNGWRTASRQPVKNQELWQELKSISDRLSVSWHWVKGHAGNTWNERCDALVKIEMDRLTGR